MRTLWLFHVEQASPESAEVKTVADAVSDVEERSGLMRSGWLRAEEHQERLCFT